LLNFLCFVLNISDAPALSTDEIAPVVVGGDDVAITEANDSTEQWDDEALAATLTQKKAVAASGNASELLDMKALDLKRSEQGDIQEKLRLEENKAKLAAAREGMEKEAQRLREEKERKEQGSSASVKPRFGAAAAGMAPGGTWLPPHMRGGGTALPGRLGMGSSTSQKLDTEDENLFPDLASADAILEKQKSQGPAYKAPKKTPAGGGTAWGSKPKDAPIKKSEPDQAESVKAVEPVVAESSAEMPIAAADSATDAAPAQAADAGAANAKVPIKPKKKKKKDLSTFKSSS
jgi:hypothetical protein